jgi:hypothetical protein
MGVEHPRTGPPGSGMQAFSLRYREFRLPRRGASLEECQDAAAGSPERGRFAIADGASESWSPALWAKLLVETFVESESHAGLSAWLKTLQQRWDTLIEEQRGPTPPPLPWYLEDQYRQGAFATFLGLILHAERVSRQPSDQSPSQGGEKGSGWRWQALAVGDSCLFQIREGRLIESFPLSRAEEFGSQPWLVGSRTSELVPQSQSLTRKGDVLPRDKLWLMTDALGQWFLRQVEAGGRPWEELDRLLAADRPDDKFAAWVEDLRTRRKLRNDDVTLMAVSLE